MANNRMYLRFRPTGEKIMLGKRLVTTGYYKPPHPSEMAEFFSKCLRYLEGNGFQPIDDFELVFEHDAGWDVKIK